jgi:hypothetical protein
MKDATAVLKTKDGFVLRFWFALFSVFKIKIFSSGVTTLLLSRNVFHHLYVSPNCTQPAVCLTHAVTVSTCVVVFPVFYCL